jgi:hypothetical protein
MNIPNADRVYEFWYPLQGDDLILQLRNFVLPLIRDLQNRRVIGWFAVHVHSPNQCRFIPKGDITDLDANGFHFRLELLDSLPVTAITAVIPPGYHGPGQGLERNVSGITDIPQPIVAPTSLCHGTIDDIWRVIGEASDWVLSLLEAYDSDTNIPPEHFPRLIHFIMNLLQPSYTSYQTEQATLRLEPPLNGAGLF